MADSDSPAARTGRLALLFAAHAVGTANIMLVVALSPSIEASLDLGHAAFGLMVSAYYAAMLVLALPAGWLVDRFGLRNMLVAAHLLLAIGLLALAAASGLATGAFGLILCGCGYAIINPSTARGVLMWFPPGGRATAMGVKQTGVPAGGVVAALVATAGQTDWRALAAGLAVVTFIAGLSYLALRVPAQAASLGTRFGDLRALLRMPRLVYFNAGACVYGAGQSAFFTYLVLYAHDVLAAPLAMASLCLAIAHTASATGRICWGVISDRLLRSGRTASLVAIGLCAAVGIMLLAGLPALGAAALVATTALVGFTLAGYAGLTQTAAVEAVEPARAGASIGYTMLMTSFGTMIGPVAFGIGIESVGYAATWSVLAALLLGGAALFRASTKAAARASA